MARQEWNAIEARAREIAARGGIAVGELLGIGGGTQAIFYRPGQRPGHTRAGLVFIETDGT